jgi:hypothetical protein
MKYLPTLLLVLSVFAFAADEPVPVYEEPRHRLMLDGGIERVLDLSIAPGDTTLFHIHDQPIFYITLSQSQLRTQRLGSAWNVQPARPWQAGDVRVNDSYIENPATHRVNNIGDEYLRLILILNERRAPFAPGIDVHPQLPGEPEIDNQHFAQSRIELEAGQSLTWDGVRARMVFVLISDTHVVIRSKNNQAFGWGMTTPGDFEIINGDGGFRFENRGDQQATIIAVAIL